MLRRITGLRQSPDEQWVAELECGHENWVRHNPPWENRPWILSEETRQAQVGTTMSCAVCRVPFKSPPRD